jgi:hypothetical protein
MEYQDCINFEQTEQGSDVLTIIVTLLLLLLAIISAECNN